MGKLKFDQDNIASRTPPEMRAALEKRKKFQEARGKDFHIKQPIQRDPRQIERAAIKAYRRRQNILIQLVRERLIERLPDLIAGDDSEKPETVTPKKTPRGDALPDDIATIIGGIRVEFARRFSQDELRAIAQDLGLAVTQHNLRELNKVLKTTLNVDVFKDEPFLQGQMDNFVAQNVNLITSVDDRYYTEIEEIVFRGARQGTNIKEISRQIRQRGNVSKSRADLIARDQVQKFNGQLSQLRQTDIGVGRYIWRTSLDERVRPEHAAREGKVFSWDDPPFDGHPGEPINCRCYAEPVLEDLIE
jgi:SPP1 gp7 family putative phage head morphogenesis protein